MKYSIWLALLLSVVLAAPACAATAWPSAHLIPGGRSPISEPYPEISGGAFTGPPASDSPDPLVRYRWPAPKASDGLQVYLLRPVSVTTDAPRSFQGLKSATSKRCGITVRGPGSIRLDFGVESAAWLEFDSPDLSGSFESSSESKTPGANAPVEMSIGEYNEPQTFNGNPGHSTKTMAPKRIGNTYRLELNPQLYEGVRFGWIHVRSCPKPWHITAVRLVCQIKPTNYEGSFSCSDPLLNRVWYAGAYDVKLNLLKDYFGAILIDRGDRISWTGDAHPAQAAALVAFDNTDFVRQNLDRTANDSNGIESYSLYWILSLLDYTNYSGDTETFRRYVPLVERKLEHGSGIYADPPIAFYGWDERLGAGFETPNRPETKNAYRMLFIEACRRFASEAATMSLAGVSARWRQVADRRVEDLRKNGGWAQGFGAHAASDAINAGFTTPEEQRVLYRRDFAIRLNRLSYSPFNEYFILQAMGRMGRWDEALATVRDCWGGQIEYGGTTFFEVYRPSWNSAIGRNDPVPNCQCGFTSLCHPWGAGVTKWLTEEIAGIKPTSPGFATVDIVPHPGRTLSRVGGVVMTPHGPIHASFNLKSGSDSVDLPAGVVGRIGIPMAGRTITRIRVNGRVVWPGSSLPSSPGIRVDLGARFVYLNGVRAGHSQIQVEYHGRAPRLSLPKLTYPAPAPATDSATGGDWGGKYGHDGWVLFSYGNMSKNLESLPSYVTAVTPNGASAACWAPSTRDRRAPAPDPGNGAARAAGCVYGNPTMSIDIAAKPGKRYRLALYFLDWDHRGRRSAIEIFDLRTLRLLTPVRVVSDYTQGKYLVYRLKGPVRIRVDQVRGDNAVLSALFFDPSK
ncbi:MAG TPA: alpha-L-rhamnosidase C-terminal domain-containing protein [Armatimonadota bacterium]|nr:alpha-L-rhamnosidase C-terminal domain-containing protein [Armatimonadota bacterium]